MSEAQKEEASAILEHQDYGIDAPMDSGGKVSEEIGKALEREVGKSEDVTEAASSTGRTEGQGQVMLPGGDDVLTAIYKETGIEIVSRTLEEADDANDQDVATKNEDLSDAVASTLGDTLKAKPEDHSTSTDQLEQIVPNSASVGSEIKTDGLESDQIGKPKIPDKEEETILAARQDDQVERVGDKDLDQVLESEKTPSPFIFPMPLPSPEPQTDTSKPQDPLAKLLDPSTKRLAPTAKAQDPSSKSPINLPSKTRAQNLSTESLQLTSRIPRANAKLGRSVSMVTPRVSSPVPPKGDKTPTKRPLQKIPHLIHAQRRPGGLLKRSVSVMVSKKKPTELAEGMTLVLAVPVTHTTQSVSRSSVEASQQFVISPYQEEHVLAATCPISGITRHIKIIL